MRKLDSDTIRVFLVDDHAVVRAGLAAYLDTDPGMAVLGEATNGDDAIRRLAVLANTDGLPDVVLMDLLMPVTDGIATTAQIKQRWPLVEVVVVTSFRDEDKIKAALEAGASGYLLKNADAAAVTDAIRAAVAGEMHIDPAAAKSLTAALRTATSAVDELTPRERDVVVLIADGATNQQIASRLGVTERTARTHVSHILTKLGLASRTQAAMWAVRHGLVPAQRTSAQ